MRVFIGIPATRLKSEYLSLKDRNKDIRVSWLPPDDLHITLIPPWKTENMKEEITKLKIFKNILKPTSVNFNIIEKRKNLIWTTGPSNKKLGKIKKSLEKVFLNNRKDRELIPHITLARKIERYFPSQRVDWKLEVNKIALYESITNSKNKRYKILYTMKVRE